MNKTPLFRPPATYPAIYRDAQGEIPGIIENDGIGIATDHVRDE